MKKDFSAIVVLHFLLFIGSCSLGSNGEDDCVCPSGTFEVDIYSLDLASFADRDFQMVYNPNSSMDSAPIQKENVVISVFLEYMTNQVSMDNKTKETSYFGFLGAYACSCAAPPTIVLDPIETITILQWDAELEVSKDVTAAFGELFLTEDRDGSINSVEESLDKSKMLQENLFFNDSFAFVIEDEDLIENEGYFQFEFTLKSGRRIDKRSSFFIFQ